MNNSKNIETIIQLMQMDASVDAPTDSLKWSKNIFRTRSAAPKKSAVARILAVLRVDLSPASAIGERSTSAAEGRQLLFEAEGNSIDLRIKPTKSGFIIFGQILGEGFGEATVKIGDFETTANDLSEFSFFDIPAGSYDLTLRSAEKEITVSDLEIH